MHPRVSAAEIGGWILKQQCQLGQRPPRGWSGTTNHGKWAGRLPPHGTGRELLVRYTHDAAYPTLNRQIFVTDFKECEQLQSNVVLLLGIMLDSSVVPPADLQAQALLPFNARLAKEHSYYSHCIATASPSTSCQLSSCSRGQEQASVALPRCSTH
jgi:hypothetical protein